MSYKTVSKRKDTMRRLLETYEAFRGKNPEALPWDDLTMEEKGTMIYIAAIVSVFKKTEAAKIRSGKRIG